MTENKLQHKLIMWFGQTWPEYQNFLFEVNNNPKNEAHGAYRKAMGMKKSVSDLILIQPKFAKTIGIELKAPGNTWSRSKIINQLNWGKGLIKESGYYIMSSDIDLLKQFITFVIENNIYMILKTQQMALSKINLTNKTVKF